MHVEVTMTGCAPQPLTGPTGAVLLALRLSAEARGIKGLDVLRRSVDRAPPTGVPAHPPVTDAPIDPDPQTRKTP